MAPTTPLHSSRFVPRGIALDELMDKVRRYVAEKSFDHIYLATEDASIFQRFMESELADRVFCVDQTRIDYAKPENYSKLLLDIYERDGGDARLRTLTYLAVLEGQIRCDALVANVSCGAVTYSLGWDPDYEFVDVPKIMPSV